MRSEDVRTYCSGVMLFGNLCRSQGRGVKVYEGDMVVTGSSASQVALPATCLCVSVCM